MDQEVEKLIAENFAKLPKDLQKSISALPLTQIAQDIATKNKLHIDQSGTIYIETLLALLNIEKSSDLSKNIQAETGVTMELANAIVNDLNEKVFKILRLNIQQQINSAQSQVDFGSKLNAQAMAYPPKSPQPLMTPRSAFSAPASKPAPQPLMAKPTIPAQSLQQKPSFVSQASIKQTPAAPVPSSLAPKPPFPVQQPPQPSIQTTQASVPRPINSQFVQPKPPIINPNNLPVANQQTKPNLPASPTANNPAVPSAPKIVPLMKKEAILAEIENPTPTAPSFGSNSGRGMIDDKMAEKFIAGKLKKISENQIQKTVIEPKPPQASNDKPADPYRENL